MNRRVLAVALVTALVAGLGAGPATESFANHTKKHKKKKPKVCKPMTPSAEGQDKPVIKITDAATEEKPVVQTITLGEDFDEGLQGDAPADAFNVQVDSKAKTAGLYVTFTFQPRRDYDLWTYWSDSSVAASSHGFNPVVEAKTPPPAPDASNTSDNHAGESTPESENIVALITPDCGGWTLGFENYFGEGGDFDIEVWLGEGQTEPKPPGEEVRE